MPTKIALGIPTNRGVKPETVKCLLEMINHEKRDFLIFIATEGYTIAENRNYLVTQALNAQCDYILMIDDDMTFPVNTLTQLLRAEQPIVGVASNSRKLPLRTTVEMIDGSVPTPEELPPCRFPCLSVGGGVLLIDMKVFETLPRPWFAMTTDERGFTTEGEDRWFCRRVMEEGYQVYCDPTLEIGHLGTYKY